jgi:hypothetical protein
MDPSWPLCAAVIAAGREIGQYRKDVNNPPPGAGDGIVWCQQTRGGHRRASAARTYLHPAIKRPHLLVVTKALVRRRLFDGKHAIDVAFERAGTVERAEADREVTLSAGAISSTACSCRVPAPRASGPSASWSATTCRGRPEPAGPLRRPHQLRRPGHSDDGQRALDRYPARRRRAVFSRHEQGHADYSASLVAA